MRSDFFLFSFCAISNELKLVKFAMKWTISILLLFFQIPLSLYHSSFIEWERERKLIKIKSGDFSRFNSRKKLRVYKWVGQFLRTLNLFLRSSEEWYLTKISSRDLILRIIKPSSSFFLKKIFSRFYIYFLQNIKIFKKFLPKIFL